MIRRLVDQLGDDEFAVREAATAELTKIGPPALAALTEAISSPDPEVRTRARRICNRLGESVAVLRTLIRDDDPKTRRRAVASLIRLGFGQPGEKSAVVETLLTRLRDPDEPTRSEVIDGVVRLSPGHRDVEAVIPFAARGGKYDTLLRRLYVPQDEQAYTKFHDYGAYSGTSWASYTELPPGYWVYVAPHWYIWKVEKK